MRTGRSHYNPRRNEAHDVILRLLLIYHTEKVLDCRHLSFPSPVESLTLQGVLRAR